MAAVVHPSEDVQQQLRGSVRAVVNAFAKYQLPPGFADRCSPVSWRRDVANRLVASGPDASLEDLARYEPKALSTMGDDLDLKYFTPMIFAAMAEGLDDTTPWFRLAIGHHANIFSKLKKADASSWPGAEFRAIEGVAISLWLNILGTYPAPYTPLEFLENVQGVLALEPLLDMWTVGVAQGLQLAEARSSPVNTRSDAQVTRWLHADSQLATILDSSALTASAEAPIAQLYDGLSRMI